MAIASTENHIDEEEYQESSDHYADSGYSFHEVLIDGQLGGYEAVFSYVDGRLVEYKRVLRSLDETDDEYEFYDLAVLAFSEAKKLLPALKAEFN